jgi:glycosyltransferase involved in cell wall biosynthesis
MKVLVLNNMAPFVHGGAEELTSHLVHRLRESGVEAEAMRIPFAWEPAERVIEEIMLARSLRIANADRVIALKFPLYLVEHPCKIVWLLHQFRQAYDLWDAGQSNLGGGARGEALRAMIMAADNAAFGAARSVYAASPVSQARLARYNNLHVPSLPAPPNDPELFGGGPDEGYILAAGRVGQAKRQALLVQALAHAPVTRLVIAGPPDSAGEADALRRLVEAEGVADRVTLDLRLLARAELASLVNRARAVAYLPFDEDSVGYVTMEAFLAGKPVITASDSGGTLELVRDGETGLVADPEPRSLGDALRGLTAARAATLGRAGKAAMEARAITWPATIERLLA